MNIYDKIKNNAVLPVVVIENSSDASDVSDALYSGGLKCAEITFRTSAAEDSIRIISRKHPDMLIGAGTVLTCEQVDKAINAGAEFIVSPGMNPKVVNYCKSKDITIIPGCVTPGEIEAAIDLGLDVVKFFPAEQFGGVSMIKALSAPYTNIRFVPTGGVNSDNLLNYLSVPSVLACGGSWMVNKKLINEHKFDEIRTLTAQAVEIINNFRKEG